MLEPCLQSSNAPGGSIQQATRSALGSSSKKPTGHNMPQHSVLTGNLQQLTFADMLQPLMLPGNPQLISLDNHNQQYSVTGGNLQPPTLLLKSTIIKHKVIIVSFLKMVNYICI